MATYRFASVMQQAEPPNTFAARYLVPPEYVALMASTVWTEETVLDVAQKMRVSVSVLLVAMQDAGRMSQSLARSFKQLKVSRYAKVDPEVPQRLTGNQRAAKVELLKRGLSDHYVKLCFDAYDSGIVSVGRLAELLFGTESDVKYIGSLYGWRPKHGD